MTQSKTIFIDIDGTLINEHKEIPNETLKEINRILTNYDIKLFLISSRMPRSIKQIALPLTKLDGIVAYNGSIIKLCSNKEIIDSMLYLDRQILELIHNELFNMEDVSLNFYLNDFWLSTNNNNWTIREGASTETIPDMISKDSEIIFEYFKKGAHKILIRSNDERMNEIEHIFNRLNISSLCNLYKVKSTLFELYPFKVNKSLAVETIQTKFKVNLDDTIAIGDGENDIEMIEKVGFGVAMENGNEKLKSVADFVTKSNNNNGIEFVLKKIFK